MAVREFSLINEKGQRYSLMDIKKYCLLTEPNGFGYAYNNEYSQTNNEFILNVSKLEQGKISGDLNFKSYDNYFNLINFIETSQKLMFAYKIPFENRDPTEFFKDIKIQSISKTQIQKNGIITEQITFECLSLWYEQNEIVYKIEKRNNERRWNWRWNSRYTSYSSRNIVFENKGHVEAPIKVQIDGYIKNPKIEVLVDDEVYASIQIPIEILEYEKFLYSSKTGELYIKKQNTDGTTKTLIKQGYVKLENNNWFKLPLRNIYN